MLGGALTMPGETESVSSKLSALLPPVCTAPVWLFLRNSPGRALAAWFFATALVITVQIFWAKRRFLWFWITAAILVALHVLLVLYVPWPNVYTTIGGPAFVPFGLLDFGVYFVCFKLAEKMAEKV